MSDENPGSKELTFPPLKGIGSRISATYKTCGECAFFQPHKRDVTQGACHGNPPGITFTEQGPINLRPGVHIKERACRHWEANA